MANAFAAERASLIRRHAGYRFLFAARASSATGTYLATAALALDVYDRTHSTTWVGALFMAEWIPSLALGFVAGPLLDRLSRKKLMVCCDLASAAIFFALVFTNAPWQIVALILPVGIATGLFTPSVYSSVPTLVDETELPVANSLLQMVENVARVAGPAIGGLLVATVGAHTAYALNAITFLVSAYWLSRIPATGLQKEAAPRECGHWRQVRAGFAALRRTSAVMTVVMVWGTCIFGFTIVNAALPALARMTLRGGDVSYGLMLTASGLGLFAGGLSAPTLIKRLTKERVYPLGILVCGCAIAALSASPDTAVAAPLLFAMGAGNGAAVVCNALLLQQSTSAEMRGRIIIAVMGIGNTVGLLGFVSAGPLANTIGVRATFVTAAAVIVAGSVVAFLRLVERQAAAAPLESV